MGNIFPASAFGFKGFSSDEIQEEVTLENSPIIQEISEVQAANQILTGGAYCNFQTDKLTDIFKRAVSKHRTSTK